MGTHRENIIPGNLCIMKANVRYRQKVIFSIEDYFLIQCKDSEQPWCSALI